LLHHQIKATATNRTKLLQYPKNAKCILVATATQSYCNNGNARMKHQQKTNETKRRNACATAKKHYCNNINKATATTTMQE
jgi:hypothetical protein